MAFSLGVGFRLSDTRILVHEANVWAAINAAKSSVPLSVSPFPKKYAEWLLLGNSVSPAKGMHAPGDQWEWMANVKWGDTSKSVNCKASVDASGFAALSMDHASVGTAVVDGAINRSFQAETPLMLIGMLGAGAHSSAAMSPIDMRWPECQKWLPKSGTSPEQMEKDGTHLGWPKNIDLRSFQQSYSNQWSKIDEWPLDLKFALHGFGKLGQALEGKLPQIKPHMMLVKMHNNEKYFFDPGLKLQTAWLLPDSDIAVLWWRGEASIEYLLDDSIKIMAGMIANANDVHKESRLKEIIDIRTGGGVSNIVMDSDFPLMPNFDSNLVWEQIFSATDHPNAKAVPKSHGKILVELEESWSNLLALNNEFQALEIEKRKVPQTPANYSPLPDHFFPEKISESFPDIFKEFQSQALDSEWAVVLSSKIPVGQRKINEKVITNQDFSGLTIAGWHMDGVRFERCDLRRAQIVDCTLDNVDFVDCMMDDAIFQNLNWSKGGVNNSSLNDVKWIAVKASDLIFENLASEGWMLSACSIVNSIVDGGVFFKWIFNTCQVESLSYMKCRVTDGAWYNSKFTDITVVDCYLVGLLIDGVSVDKFSVIDGVFDGFCSKKAKLNCFVLSGKSSMSDASFFECVLEKGCWIGVVAKRLKVENSSFEKINLEGAEIQLSSWRHSIFTGSHIKGADATGSHWQQVALGGANLCAVNLSNAIVEDCNLVNSVFAWAKLNSIEDLRSRNVTQYAQFYPRGV